DYNFAMLVGGCLDGINNNILDSTRELNRIAENDAFFIRDVAVELDAVLRSHATNALADVLDDAGNRDWFGFSGADLTVALPHGEKLTAKPNVLLDDLKFSWRARRPQAIISVAGLFQFLGQNLDVTPDDGERVTQIVHKLSRRLAERSKTFLLSELIPQALVKLLNFARGRLALPLQTSPFHVAADHFAHLDRIKGFVDVI